MFKTSSLLFLTSLFLAFPVNASACDLENKAQNYINKVYSSSSSHYGTKKPILKYNTTTLKKSGNNKYAAGYSDTKNIAIYQKAYDRTFGKKCTEAHWEDLKRVVAHEYGHHIDLNHGKGMTKLLKTSDEERAAIVGGEHILHERAWGKKGRGAQPLKKSEKSKYAAVKKYLESL